MTTVNAEPEPPMATSNATTPKTAKLFKNGRSQAVRLPKEFRFEGNEVAIRRDRASGEVILTPSQPARALTFDEWFALYCDLPDSATDEDFARLPPRPGNLSVDQLARIFDRAAYPQDFFERRASMPRPLDVS
jgi:antitoxin VapB